MLKYHIQTVELTSAQASISFNSIPQDFTDLVFLFSARENATGFTGSYLVGSFNSTTAGYSIRIIEGNGSSAGSATFTSGIDARIMATAPGAVPTANTFSNGSLYIPNYTSSNNKSYSSDSVWENNATTAVQEVLSGLWSNSAAITSATFTGWAGFNLAAGSSISLYGVKRGSDGRTEVASGGVISTSGGYTIHTFNTSGTFVANRDLNVEYVVVGGGGGGAEPNNTGGGGAGGYRSSVVGEMSGGGAAAEPKLNLVGGTSYLVTVGAGGTDANGSNSSFSSITSLGGGPGGTYAQNGIAGGSGGGGSFDTDLGGAGTAGQGFAGGNSVSSSAPFGTGGGGGAGGLGGNTVSGVSGGNGGAGLSSSITGSPVARAGGGSGSSEGGTTTTTTGGGGVGANSNNATSGSGVANTGGGGGGAPGGSSATPGAGGSGVVIIRYLTP